VIKGYQQKLKTHLFGGHIGTLLLQLVCGCCWHGDLSSYLHRPSKNCYV